MNFKKPFVITISRQLGSGGAYIGQQLAKKLNIYYADNDIISKAAKQLSVLEKDIESREEKTLSFWQSFLEFSAFATDTYIPPKLKNITDNDLFETETEIIKHIAREHSAVIMGRCGFNVLRKHPNRVSIFLYADVAFRNKRVQDLYNVSEETAKKMIAQSDKDRGLYISTFTENKWTDARNFNLCIDTSKIGVDKTIELILNYLK